MEKKSQSQTKSEEKQAKSEEKQTRLEKKQTNSEEKVLGLKLPVKLGIAAICIAIAGAIAFIIVNPYIFHDHPRLQDVQKYWAKITAENSNSQDIGKEALGLALERLRTTHNLKADVWRISSLTEGNKVVGYMENVAELQIDPRNSTAYIKFEYFNETHNGKTVSGESSGSGALAESYFDFDGASEGFYEKVSKDYIVLDEDLKCRGEWTRDYPSKFMNTRSFRIYADLARLTKIKNIGSDSILKIDDSKWTLVEKKENNVFRVQENGGSNYYFQVVDGNIRNIMIASGDDVTIYANIKYNVSSIMVPSEIVSGAVDGSSCK